MSNQQQTGIINIRGKEYKTVALRVSEFREQEPYKGYALITEVMQMDNIKVIVKASVLDANDRIVATGHAEEVRSSGNINKTSALENCETSAIGRALASLGLAGQEFASANEVQGAMQQQNTGARQDQVALIQGYLASGTISAEHMVQSFGHAEPAKLLQVEADRIINAVTAALSTQPTPEK